MSEATETTDQISYVAIYIRGEDSHFRAPVSYWNELDAAYHQFIERRIDRVISLDTLDGSPLLLAASLIGGLVQSSSASRERARAIDEALKAESGFVE